MDDLIKAIEALIDKKLDAYTVKFNENTIPFIAGFTTQLTLEVIKAENQLIRSFTAKDFQGVFSLMENLKNFNPREVVPMYLRSISKP
jgi:hypothetical protein